MAISVTGELSGVFRRSDKKVVTLQDGVYKTAAELGLVDSSVTVPVKYQNGLLMVSTDAGWMYAKDADIQVGFGSASASSSGAGMQGVQLVQAGDSLTQSTYALRQITAISRSAGIVTVTLASAAALAPGFPIDIVGVQDDMTGRYSVLDGSGSSWRYVSAGADGPGTLNVNGNAYMADLSKFADSGFMVWGNARMKGRFEIVKVSAGVGRTSAYIHTKLPEVTSVGASVGVILNGTNDVLAVASAATLAQQRAAAAAIITESEAMYEEMRAAGLFVIILTIPPLALPAWNDARTAVINEVNEARKAYSAKHNDTMIIDTFAALVDPLATNKGSAKANMLKVGDGIHWTQRGANEVGKLFELAFASTPRVEFRTTNNGDNYATTTSSNNIQPSGLWVNSGGTVNAPSTGTISAGYTGLRFGSATIAYSSPLRTDGYGYDIQALVTPTADNDGMRVHSANAAVSVLTAGSSLQLDASVTVTGVVGGAFRNVNHLMPITISGTEGTIQCMFSEGSTGADCVQEDLDLVLRSPRVTLAIAPSSGYTQTTTTHGGAGTQVTVRAGRISARYKKP